jgi:threonine dehydrogenase-like Zn-dependent dehydrogenase
MKTVRITGQRQCDLIDKPEPSIGGNYVLLKVEVAPMCNEYLAYRDLVFLERNQPDSLGHELAGVVVQAPDGAAVRPGDRVVALCGFPCGRCELCRRGYYAHCADTEDPLEVCDSGSGECGFAQYAVKPDWLLLRVPDGVSLEHASMACCGLGPTFGVMERIRADAFATVLITGLGAVGLGGVINAKFRGATVIGIARSPYRSKLARELGCDVVLDPREDDIRARIMSITGGKGVDIAIDCSGQSEYQRLAVDVVRRLGTVAFLAEPGELQVNVDADLVQKGVTLLGSLDLNRADAPRLLEMISRIPEQIDTFITHRYPLDRIAEAFEQQTRHECGKIILYPWA